MRNNIICLLAVVVLAGCASSDKQDKKFRLIWRETSNVPIEQVFTPDGFEISPAKAVKPLMDRSSRAPWAEFYLFVDNSNYYFGNTRKGTELTCPETGYWIIDGITGKTLYKESE
jgi:hypothetical protein